MTLKRGLLTGIVCFFYVTSFSQRNFEPGYIILLKGDTVRGFINNLDWKKNPTKIDFRTSLNGESTTYSPNEISYFFISESQELYKGVTMTIDKSPTDMNALTENSHMQSKEETLFLKALISGPVSLYYAYDFKDHLFLEKNGGPIEELIFQLKLTKKKNPMDRPAGLHTQKETGEYRNTGDKSIITPVEKYKFQLINAFADCSGLNNAIQKIKFNRSDVQKIVNEYYSCKKLTKVSHDKTRKKIKTQVGVIAGITSVKFSVESNDEFLKGSNFQPITSPVGGAFFNFVFPRKRESISIYSEVLYQKAAVESVNTVKYSAYSMVYTNRAEFSLMTFSVGGRIAFPNKKIQPFCQLGMATSLVLDRSFEGKKEQADNGDVTLIGTEVHKMETHRVGVWIGAGIHVSRFGIEGRYYSPEGSRGSSDPNPSKMKLLTAALSYKLKK